MADKQDKSSLRARTIAIETFAKGRGAATPDPAGLDPQDAAALADVERFWDELDAAEHHPDVQHMLAGARARLEQDSARKRQRHVRWALAASLALAVVGGATWVEWRPSGEPVARVAVAAPLLSNGRALPRTVSLTDGTRLTLDADSAVRIDAWGAGPRVATLVKGRAYLQVVHDAQRPMTLRVGDVTVNDLGTRFEATRTANGATIMLDEGAVDIATPRTTGGAGASYTLRPGMRLVWADATAHIARSDGEPMPGWRDNVLTVQDRPVAELVAEVNRYLANPLVLADAASGDIRVSGVFRLDDPRGLRRALLSMGVRRLDFGNAATEHAPD
ncbi:MAG: FecR domain-containing protein [Sphingobium sp.]